MVFTFDASMANEFLRALQAGEPIQPPAGGWTQAASLTLCGVARAHCESHGPRPHTPETWTLLDKSEQHQTFNDFQDDLNAALTVITPMVHAIIIGTYGELFEQRVIVDVSIVGEPRIEYLCGVKGKT